MTDTAWALLAITAVVAFVDWMRDPRGGAVSAITVTDSFDVVAEHRGGGVNPYEPGSVWDSLSPTASES